MQSKRCVAGYLFKHFYHMHKSCIPTPLPKRIQTGPAYIPLEMRQYILFLDRLVGNSHLKWIAICLPFEHIAFNSIYKITISGGGLLCLQSCTEYGGGIQRHMNHMFSFFSLAREQRMHTGKRSTERQQTAGSHPHLGRYKKSMLVSFQSSYVEILFPGVMVWGGGAFGR